MHIPYNNKKDKKIIIFSGAGLDAPSGISTFRGVEGLWENHKIEEICNEQTWKHNFESVHKFYNERRAQLSEVEPNIAHYIIKRIVEKYGKENVYNISQNVSDLFEQAGTEVLHLHGELTKMECEACGENWDIGYKRFDIEKDRCPKCNSLKAVRPKIVFFYGSAPMYAYLNRAMYATMNENTIVVVIGTMGNVVPIQHHLDYTKCKKILCNMEPSDSIKHETFDRVYFESITTAIEKIEKDIDEFWNI